MSIVTKTGDAGTTAMMFNRRVPKSHPRVEACGNVDELNAALGLARSTADHAFVQDHLLGIQKDLVLLMGEIATLKEDLPRLTQSGYSIVTPALTLKLDDLAGQIESQNVAPKDWAFPGATVSSAALDLARTACRKAERQICALKESEEISNPEILIYLNRLSDVLWLLARWVDSKAGLSGQPGEVVA
jgi:cob(I)alamin adenosyltransferase